MCINLPIFTLMQFNWLPKWLRGKDSEKKTIPEPPVQKELPDSPIEPHGNHLSTRYLPFNSRADAVKMVAEVPQAYSVIEVKRNAFANGIFRHKELMKDGTIKELFGTNMLKLLKKPNPVQTCSEFLKQYYSFWQADGNGMCFTYVPTARFKAEGVRQFNALNMWVMPSQYMTAETTKTNMFIASNKSEIIHRYILQDFTQMKFLPDMIMHVNKPTLNYNNTNWLFGDSPVEPLARDLSNIVRGKDATNVALVDGKPITAMSAKGTPKDAYSSVTKTPEQLKDTEKRVNRYNMQPGGERIMMFTSEYDVKVIGYNIKDLEVMERAEQSLATISNVIGCPIPLVQSKNSKYSDIQIARKALYTQYIIPDARELSEHITSHFNLDKENQWIELDYSHIPELQADAKEAAKVIDIQNKSILEVTDRFMDNKLDETSSLKLISRIIGKSVEDSRVYLPQKSDVEINVVTEQEKRKLTKVA